MPVKLITFTVPCYNSADYMEHCIESLLSGGDDIEIILVDDGSTKDDTPAICDRYAAQYPDIVRAIHQENGGHGAGVNQGLRLAAGQYFKVVDSDDWLDRDALQTALKKLRALAATPEPLDLLICNYVYEHVANGISRPMHYKNVFPVDKLFTWEDCGRFRLSQYLLMHSVIYRTALLRECGLELPRHTFYVDNIFVYQPLPAVKSIYYLDLDLYRYFIGRADQSVNEQVMVTRVDQQLRVTQLMLGYYNLKELGLTQPKLSRYMFNYLAMMMAICSTFLNLDGSPEALEKKQQLWTSLKRDRPEIYTRMRFLSVGGLANMPGAPGRKLEIHCYHIANRIFKFN